MANRMPISDCTSYVDGGNAKERIEICLSTDMIKGPREDFLGKRQHMKVGTVNYTYYQFGPQEVGLPKPSKLTELDMPNLLNQPR